METESWHHQKKLPYRCYDSPKKGKLSKRMGVERRRVSPAPSTASVPHSVPNIKAKKKQLKLIINGSC